MSRVLGMIPGYLPLLVSGLGSYLNDDIIINLGISKLSLYNYYTDSTV